MICLTVNFLNEIFLTILNDIETLKHSKFWFDFFNFMQY